MVKKLSKTVYLVEPNPMFGWNFKKSGSKSVIKFDPKKSDLLEYARAYCKDHNSELLVLDFNWEIEEKLEFSITND